MGVLHPTFMLVTDLAQAIMPLPDVVAAALSGGCRRVLFRAPELSDADYLALGKVIRASCLDYDADFFVSHRTHFVKELQANGLHLSSRQSVKDERRLAGNVIIGQSCHSDAELSRAMAEGADMVTLSPIFISASKPDYGPALGVAALHDMAASCPVPVYAQGGVTPENAGACLAAGAQGVAIMGPVMRASQPDRVVARYIASCVAQMDKLSHLA